MKLSQDAMWCLKEAYRRNITFGRRPDNKDKLVTDRWLGLGTYSQYRGVIKLGLMKFVDDKRPANGNKGWLQLTELGVTTMLDNIEIMEASLDRSLI